MESPTPPDSDLHSRVEQQEVVADLGQLALETDDVDELMHEVAVGVAETLAVDYCGVLERVPGDGALLLRDGVGWDAAALGHATVPTTTDSPASRPVRRGEPAVVSGPDEGFDGAELLEDHDVASGISVVVGSTETPWGVLGVYTTGERTFAERDVHFVESVANVLASAIDNARARNELEEITGRISDAFFALDEEWRFAYLNDRAHELINPEGRELVGENVWETFPEAVNRQFQPKYERAMAEQETVAFEEYYPEPLDAWFAVRAYPSETGLSVYFRDVTERRERERALETRVAAIEETIEGVGILDADEEYVYVNQAHADIYGYDDPDAFVGETWRMCYEEAEIERIEAEAMPTLFEEGSWRGEATGRRRDGSTFPQELSLTALDEDRLICVVRDVTERRERERALAERERQMSTLMANVPGMVYRCANERDWPMAFASEGCRDLTGYDPEAFTEGDVSFGEDVVVEADREALWEDVQAGLEADGRFLVTYRIETAGGTRKWVRERGRGIYDDDDLDALEGVIIDVTERKRLEAELEEITGRITDAFYALDDEYRFTHVNDRAETLLQREAAALVGERLWDVLPEAADMAEVRERYRRAMETQEPQSIEVYFESLSAWVEANVYPSESGLSVYARDVTERVERERALAESERRFRTLAENFPNGGVGVFDESLRYTLVTGTMWEDIDVDAADLEGRTVREALPPATADDVEPIFEAALEGETGTVVSELGGRTYRVWATPLRDGDDEVVGGHSFALDVTEQRERERHLERYRTVVEAVDDGVYVLDEDGDFAMVNEAYAEMVGYDREELVGTPATRVADAEAVERVDELRAATDEGGLERHTVETELTTASGERLPVEATIAPPPDDGDGEWHRIGVVRDVSDRQARQRALEESERRYRTLVENFPDGAVALVDEDMCYQIVGGDPVDAAADSGADHEGRPVAEAVSEPLAEVLVPRYRAALEGESSTFEVEHQGRYSRFQTFPVRDDDGSVLAAMGVSRDITEHVEYQRRLEASNERLEQFAHAASHDLQEPLRMVSSYLQLVENRYADELDEEGREFIEFAVDGADRMREMIEGLLAYSRVDARGDPFEPVDLADVLADVREDLQVRIEETDAEVTAGDLPRVEGDAGQLRQLLQNLLENALEYSGDAPPRVHVAAEREGDRWHLAVSDEGIGMDPADADSVFEVFERLHSREDHDGTGIGLALCERIVERHGGDIWVETAPGEGSTFHVTLPSAGEADDGE